MGPKTKTSPFFASLLLWAQLISLLSIHTVSGWLAPSRLRLSNSQRHFLSITNIQSQLKQLEERLREQELPEGWKKAFEAIPPSNSLTYKSDELRRAYSCMVDMLEQNSASLSDLQMDVVEYYLQTLHTACQDIMGHVYINLALDVYQTLTVKRPLWCRYMYEILHTSWDESPSPTDLQPILKDWLECGPEDEVKHYLKQNNRSDLWELLDKPSLDEQQVIQAPERATGADENEESPATFLECHTENKAEYKSVIHDKNAATEQPRQGTTVLGVETEIENSDPKLQLKGHIEELEVLIQQVPIDRSLYFSSLQQALKILYLIPDPDERDLKILFFFSCSSSFRVDATAIFRRLDQRGLVQREELFQLLYVYCENRIPMALPYVVSLLKYYESQYKRNACIRRPDPRTYRLVLESIRLWGRNGSGELALQVIDMMAQRRRQDPQNLYWNPSFNDFSVAISALASDFRSIERLKWADKLVRTLYCTATGKAAPHDEPLTPRLQQMVLIAQRLRLDVQISAESPTSPLLAVLEAYATLAKDDNIDFPAIGCVQSALSLWDYAIEQTEKGNGTLEELTKNHLSAVIGICKNASPEAAQECVRLFDRISRLVEHGMLQLGLISPSVTYQLLVLLSRINNPGNSLSAERILNHYLRRTKEPRSQAFEYVISCCCAEKSVEGCERAVGLIERAAYTFEGKNLRDSFFLDTLRQIEVFSQSQLASRVFVVANATLFPNPLDIESRCSLLMSLYRSLLRQTDTEDKTSSVASNLLDLQKRHPKHPCFTTHEFLQISEGISIAGTESEQRQSISSAINILLSSKEAGDIELAESILAQDETDGSPPGAESYKQVIEAFIGNNDMNSATNLLQRLKKFHPHHPASVKLESSIFDILLSSGQIADMKLAELILFQQSNSNLAQEMCTKVLYTYLSLPNGGEDARRVLNAMKEKISTSFDMSIWHDLDQLVNEEKASDS